MKVFIVEDSALMLENLLSILSDIPGVVIAGHAVGRADAIECIDSLLPDLVIIDIGLKNGAALGMLGIIKARHPGARIMVLTGCTDEFYFDRCKRAGADYFLDKVFQLTRIRAAVWQCVYARCTDKGLEALQAPGYQCLA